MDLPSIPGAIAGLISAVDRLATSITDAEESFTSLKTKLSSIHDRLDSLKEHVEEDQDSSTLRSTVDYDRLIKLQQTLGEIQGRLRTLESKSKTRLKSKSKKKKKKKRFLPWKSPSSSQGHQKNSEQSQSQSQSESESGSASGSLPTVSKIRWSLLSEGHELQKLIQKFLEEWRDYKSDLRFAFDLYRYEDQPV